MTVQKDLELQIGAKFYVEIECATDQTGRTHRAQVRVTKSTVTTKMDLITGDGITIHSTNPKILILQKGATGTEAIVSSEDSEIWVYDCESRGADDDDKVREAEGSVLVTRDVTRTSESTAAANASKLLTYSTDDAQTLTSEEQAGVRDKIGLLNAAVRSTPVIGNAAEDQLVNGGDTRLTNARAPTSHDHALSNLTQSGATSGQVPTWDGNAWAPATPSSGGGALSTWEAGKRLWQDTARTTPATLVGDPVLAWVSTTGEVLEAVNGTPRLTNFDGYLVPFCDGVEFQHFATTTAKTLRNVEVHGVFAQTEGGRGISITTATSFSPFGVRSVGFDIGTSDAPGSTGRGAISSVSMLGVVGYSDKQRIFLHGGELANTSGSIDFTPPQDATLPIQILGTWSHEASATPAAILRLTICERLTDSQRSQLLAEHRAFAPDRKRRVVMMHDSICGLTKDGAYFTPHGSVNGQMRINYDPICVGVAGGTFTTCTDYSNSWPAQVLADGCGPIDVVVFTTNEFTASGSGATHAANVAAFINAQKTAGVIGKAIWVCPYYRTVGATATFAAQVDIAYAALSVSAAIDGVVDLRGVITAGNGLSADGIHATRAGSATIADRIGQALFVARAWPR